MNQCVFFYMFLFSCLNLSSGFFFFFFCRIQQISQQTSNKAFTTIIRQGPGCADYLHRGLPRSRWRIPGRVIQCVTVSVCVSVLVCGKLELQSLYFCLLLPLSGFSVISSSPAFPPICSPSLFVLLVCFRLFLQGKHAQFSWVRFGHSVKALTSHTCTHTM